MFLQSDESLMIIQIKNFASAQERKPAEAGFLEQTRVSKFN